MSLPGAQAIDHAISRERLRIVSSPGGSKIDFPPALGAGERAAIELAVASKAMVLMDDRPGRRMARRCKVPVVGTGGLLLLAKNEGLVTEIKPLIVDLQAAGYRISSTLFKELLLRAGEQ